MGKLLRSTEAKVAIGGVALILLGAVLASSGNHVVETIGVFMILIAIVLFWLTWFLF